MHFDGNVFLREGTMRFVTWLQYCCIWYDSGTTSDSKSFFGPAFAECNCNLVRHGTTSELGLSDLKGLCQTLPDRIIETSLFDIRLDNLSPLKLQERHSTKFQIKVSLFSFYT